MAEFNEVQVLSCPACGALIKGSGACGCCSQLLLVTREYDVLGVTDQDIGDIKIKPPSKDESETEEDPFWEFGAGTVLFYKQTDLTILGNGSPMVGAILVAMYYADHPKYIKSGGKIADWRDVEDYSIAKILASNPNK